MDALIVIGFLIRIICRVLQKWNKPFEKPCGLECYKNFFKKWRLSKNDEVG
jgi:hypothetical protein